MFLRPQMLVDEFLEHVHLLSKRSVPVRIRDAGPSHSEVDSSIVGVVGVQMLPWRR